MVMFEAMQCFIILGGSLWNSSQECTVWFSCKYHPISASLILCAKHRVYVATLKAKISFNSRYKQKRNNNKKGTKGKIDASII